MFRSSSTPTLEDQPRIGAIYSRISTAKQKESISLDDQETRMLFYAEKNGIEVPKEYWFREQVSGFKEERTEYDKICQLIRDRQIDVLIVYSSDRYTRDPIHGIIFRAELRRSRCTLHFVTEGQVDILSPQGEILNTLKDTFNKYWAMMITQTFQDKKHAYTAAGVPLQQGRAPFGYRRIGKQSNARLEIVIQEAEVVIKIFTWFDEGVPCPEIARRLEGIATPGDRFGMKTRRRTYGNWSTFGLYSMLNNEIYAGIYYAHKFQMIENEYGEKKRITQPKEAWVPIAVPAIVSRELWERCQQRLSVSRAEITRAHRGYQYLMARRVNCRICGYRVMGNTHPRRQQAYYICNSRLQHRLTKPCDLPYLKVSTVDDVVWEFTKLLLRCLKSLR